MKLASWNVNGIRACINKGFFDWLEKQALDVICLQEMKAQFDQLPEKLISNSNYDLTVSLGDRKGYSGVATLVHKKINHSSIPQIGIEKFDTEGRCIITEFDNFVLFNGYHPNGKRDHSRVDFKLEYSEAVLKKALAYRKKNKPAILCGDFNTAHTEIDLANPKTNKKTTGFLPNERAWIDKLVKKGFIDSYRHLHPEQTGAYTWWTYRGDCRARNVGWRIDYFFIDELLEGKLKQAGIQADVMGSDHCPITLDMKM